MTKQKKSNKWTKFRHRVVRNILNCTLGVYSRIKYRIRIRKFKEQERRPYLILMNHQTPFDQFFVGMAFRGPIYYLATEDIFSNGWVSSLIKYLVAPIPIKKQTTDVRAILNCIKVSREGGTIAIAPEGNRTYSGRTEYMSPSIVSLARKLDVPIALFRIEGGYGTNPRWSDKVRKGKMQAYVSEVIAPQEYREMSDDELFARIKNGLYVNEAVADAAFVSNKKAEYLERAIYVCPHCGLSEFESSGNIVKCKKCDLTVEYTEKKELVCGDESFSFGFVADWYDYQNNYVNSLDVTKMTDEPLYVDEADLYRVIRCKNKELIERSVRITLYGNRIEIKTANADMTFPFETTAAVTVLGRNKMNIYYGDEIYQIKPPKRFNAVKYVNLFNRFKNVTKGDESSAYLGL